MGSRRPILVLLCVLASLLVPGIPSTDSSTGAQNRVWAFDLADQAHVAGQRALPLKLHPSYELAEYDSVSGSPLAARRTGGSVDDLLKGASKGKAGKTRQFDKSGGLDQANKDFDSLVGGGAVKNHGGGVRSGTLPDGSTISVRPGSTQGSPTIQINPPSEKPIKVRYGN